MFRRILACNVRLHICMCIHITYSYTCTLVSLAQMHNFHLAGYALGFMLYVLSPFTFVYRTIQPGPVIFANVRSIVDLFPRDFIFVLSTRPRTKVGQWRNGETPWNKRGGTINDQSRILNDSNETLYFSSFFFSRILPLDIERVKHLLSEEEWKTVYPLIWLRVCLIFVQVK